MRNLPYNPNHFRFERNTKLPRDTFASPDWRRAVRVVLMRAVLVLACLVVVLASAGCTPRTPAEVVQACVESNGNGEWRRSSGVSLENYCKIQFKLAAHEAMCSRHPDRC